MRFRRDQNCSPHHFTISWGVKMNSALHSFATHTCVVIYRWQTVWNTQRMCAISSPFSISRTLRQNKPRKGQKHLNPPNADGMFHSFAFSSRCCLSIDSVTRVMKCEAHFSRSTKLHTANWSIEIWRRLFNDFHLVANWSINRSH